MGTRGTYGFRITGEDYLTYNNFDSYPEGLGIELLAEITELFTKIPIKEIKRNILSLTTVNSETQPSKTSIEKYKQFGNPSVGGPMDNTEFKTWYQLLRNAQGTFVPYMDGTIQHMIVDNNFIKDSLFCEYGYILNFDTEKFEYWEGFQSEPNETNRYGQEEDEKYYPCKLMHEFKLNNLPTKANFLEITINEE